MRAFCLALIGLLGASHLSAQGWVVRPDPALDSTQTAFRDALLNLRDSLGTIDGAAARLQRDFRQASEASLVSRAKMMHEACARSLRTIPLTRKAVLQPKLSSKAQSKSRSELVKALDQLKGAVSRCQSDFAAMSQPEQGETVRGYGNDRAMRIQRELRKYDQSVSGFFAVMSIRVRPAGMPARTGS